MGKWKSFMASGVVKKRGRDMVRKIRERSKTEMGETKGGKRAKFLEVEEKENSRSKTTADDDMKEQGRSALSSRDPRVRKKAEEALVNKAVMGKVVDMVSEVRGRVMVRDMKERERVRSKTEMEEELRGRERTRPEEKEERVQVRARTTAGDRRRVLFKGVWCLPATMRAQLEELAEEQQRQEEEMRGRQLEEALKEARRRARLFSV